MSLRNIARRVERLERGMSRNRETRLSDLLTRAGQIAVRTKQNPEVALRLAIEQLGTPLSISDVDRILASAKDPEPEFRS